MGGTIDPKGIVRFGSRRKAPPYGEIHWPPPCCTTRAGRYLGMIVHEIVPSCWIRQNDGECSIHRLIFLPHVAYNLTRFSHKNLTSFPFLTKLALAKKVRIMSGPFFRSWFFLGSKYPFDWPCRVPSGSAGPASSHPASVQDQDHRESGPGRRRREARRGAGRGWGGGSVNWYGLDDSAPECLSVCLSRSTWWFIIARRRIIQPSPHPHPSPMHSLCVATGDIRGFREAWGISCHAMIATKLQPKPDIVLPYLIYLNLIVPS